MAKGTLIVLLSVLAVIAVRADDPLCAGLPSGQAVLYPSPLSCSQYFQCLNGQISQQQCADNLFYSDRLQTCVAAAYSECLGGSGSPPPSTTTTTVTTTTTPTTTTTTPTTTTTTPTTTTTTPTTTTTTPTTTTTTPTTTTTTPTTTTTTPTTTTTTPTTTTTTRTTTPTTTTIKNEVDPRCSDNSVTYWPHPVTCTKYIECYAGNSYEMPCPSGLYFSDSEKKCVDANKSDCCATSTEC